ncbi:MAG: hypothetical protein ACYTGX_04870 [Planctomycetota bacterium]|jgi:hypothetical protein
MWTARSAAGVVMSAALAGCALAPEVTAPHGPDFFPLHDGAYWFFDGIAGEDGARVGIRVVQGTAPADPLRVQIAWQAPGAAQADVMDLAAVWRDGHLVLQDKPYELRLLPERPKHQPREWRWSSGNDAFRARVLRHDGFVATPAGRWRDALVIEIGPADGSPEQWRWHFVRGEGPVRIEVGEGKSLQVLELAAQGGPRDLPSATWKPRAAPAAKPAPKKPAPKKSAPKTPAAKKAVTKKPAAPAGK